MPIASLSDGGLIEVILLIQVLRRNNVIQLHEPAFFAPHHTQRIVSLFNIQRRTELIRVGVESQIQKAVEITVLAESAVGFIHGLLLYTDSPVLDN